MREQKLKEYLEGKLSAEELAIDLKDSQKRTGHDSTAVSIESLQEGEFEITKEHLIKLCDDTLSGKLQLIDLNTIAFGLMASDFFFWDNDTEEGKLIAHVIFDWDNPEINHDISIKNILLWKDYLKTGEYKL